MGPIGPPGPLGKDGLPGPKVSNIFVQKKNSSFFLLIEKSKKKL